MCVISLAVSLGTALATSLGLATAATAATTAAVTATAAGTAAAVAGATAAGTGLAAATIAGTVGAAGAATVAGATAGGLGTIGLVSLGMAGMAVSALSAGGSLAGGTVGTVSGVQNAEMQKAQAEYQADVEAENAKIAARHAEAIKLQGNQEKLATFNEMMQTQGTGRAQYAAGGVVLGAGTPNDYEADIADAYDLDMRNLDYDIASRSWQSKAQSVSASNQASIFRAQAQAFQQQKTSSLLSGITGTAANTASSVTGAIKLFA